LKQEYIQTLHPQIGKQNKKIALHKYLVVKANILNILESIAPTHTQLMEELFIRLNGNFEGGIQWYGETVKLDLEARNIIERIKTKPEKYKLVIGKDL
jgi:hypothetical protein